MDLILHSVDRLLVGGRAFPCAIGRGGFLKDKKEGDGATPIGVYTLKRVFYRPDRLGRPMTRLPVQVLSEDDGWCDDPDDAAYNTLVKLPYDANHEVMWRDDAVYDVIVEISHNDNPPIPGAGSAVFIHIAKPDYAPTEGCVALAQPDLLEILKGTSTDTRIVINPEV